MKKVWKNSSLLLLSVAGLIGFVGMKNVDATAITTLTNPKTETFTVKGVQDSDFNFQSIEFNLTLKGSGGQVLDIKNVIMDTGSSPLVIPAEMADSLNLPHEWPISMHGIGNQTLYGYNTHANVMIGDKLLEYVPIDAVYGATKSFFGVEWFRQNGYKLNFDFDKNTFTFYK